MVIGGSGGVGRAICEELALAGTDVVLTFRGNQAAASETAEAVRAAGRRAVIRQLSIGDAAAVTSLFEGVSETRSRPVCIPHRGAAASRRSLRPSPGRPGTGRYF